MTANRVPQSSLFASQPVGSRRRPPFAASTSAAVLAFGAAQSLAWDLRAATGAVASLAPPVFGVLVCAALLTLIAAAPRWKLQTPAAILAAAATLSIAAAFIPRHEPPPLAAFGQAAQTLLFMALVGAASGCVYLRLEAREPARVSLRDYRSWLILAACALAATAAHVLGSMRILSWDPIQYWSRTDWVAAHILSDPGGGRLEPRYSPPPTNIRCFRRCFLAR